jgi:hypothetical protein
MYGKCGSHWKWKDPATNASDHVTVSSRSTAVERSTPGPVRWKLWNGD